MNMNDNQLLNQVKNAKKGNSKIVKALDFFERTQEIYERSINAITPYYKIIQRGTYSSSISKKDYHANISTTTQ